MIPAIITYAVHDVQPRDDAALTASGRFMAFAAAMVPDGRAGTSWMATGSTPEEATKKLTDMWESQFPSTPSKRGAHLRKIPENPAIAEASPLEDAEIII